MPWVNFNNILRAALMHTDLKSAKTQYSHQSLMHFWDRLKAASKHVDEIDPWPRVAYGRIHVNSRGNFHVFFCTDNQTC
jgi:hypothetical protein